MSLKRISISVAFGVVITALSHFLYSQGGEFLAVPGMFICGFIDLIVYEFSGPDEFPHLLSWQFSSIAFYFLVVYLLLARSALIAKSTGERRCKGAAL